MDIIINALNTVCAAKYNEPHNIFVLSLGEFKYSLLNCPFRLDSINITRASAFVSENIIKLSVQYKDRKHYKIYESDSVVYRSKCVYNVAPLGQIFCDKLIDRKDACIYRHIYASDIIDYYDEDFNLTGSARSCNIYETHDMDRVCVSGGCSMIDCEYLVNLPLIKENNYLRHNDTIYYIATTLTYDGDECDFLISAGQTPIVLEQVYNYIIFRTSISEQAEYDLGDGLYFDNLQDIMWIINYKKSYFGVMNNSDEIALYPRNRYVGVRTKAALREI